MIGAGIQGAAIARDASMRGLRVALLDARDVAAGTSSRSSRLVHGGLRYLRQGHVALVREALQERERLLRLAPHLVRPLPMLMPFYPDSGVARWKMRLGTVAYARLSGRSTLPKPRALSAMAAQKAFPGLRGEGLQSALEFYDARTQDGRLTLANVLAAVDAGCRFANHVEVTGVNSRGVKAVDRITGDELLVRCKTIINAAGPTVDAVRRSFGIDDYDLVRLSRGSHVVLPERAGELALAAFLPDERIQFVIPHDGGTLCGTTEVDDELDRFETPPPNYDLDYMTEALGYLLDPAPKRSELLHAYSGWRALPRVDGPPGALHREGFVVREQAPNGAVCSIVGGKLTTHRSFAERTVARIFEIDGPSRTRTTPLPGGDGPREVDDPLWWRHGSRVQLLRALLVENREFAAPLCVHRPFVVAELVHALRNEGAVTFADAMMRRLVHVRGPCLEDACLRTAHRWYARERLWPSADDDEADALLALRSEARAVTGDLAAWSEGRRP